MRHFNILMDIMKRTLLLIATACISVIPLFSQPRVPEKIDTVKLWPDGPPDAFEIPGPESGFLVFKAKDYEVPMMEVYPAKDPDGLCVIMCPGGAYIMESQTYEGREPKDWFNARGITYCMLQYRLPVGHPEVPLHDVQQAIRIMRAKAKELGITKIGIAGNSAGGHLAASAATLYVDAETRPDFQILMYPVITMDDSFTNGLSRDALIGKKPSKELVDRFSLEKHVTPDTPPAFLVLCSDDPDVPVTNSLRYYEQLVDNKVSASMHIYPTGGHGWGWKDSMLYKGNWLSELEDWLRNIALKIN